MEDLIYGRGDDWLIVGSCRKRFGRIIGGFNDSSGNTVVMLEGGQRLDFSGDLLAGLEPLSLRVVPKTRR